VGVKVSAGIEIKIEIKQGIAVSLKIIFFFFKYYNISVGIIGDSIIVIFSALETLTLEVDLIYC